jgi:hypothetical protein
LTLKADEPFADSLLDSRPGTDGNQSCGFGALRRRTRTPPPPFYES